MTSTIVSLIFVILVVFGGSAVTLTAVLKLDDNKTLEGVEKDK